MNLKKFLCNLALSLMAFILTGLGTSMSIEGAIGISSFKLQSLQSVSNENRNNDNNIKFAFLISLHCSDKG